MTKIKCPNCGAENEVPNLKNQECAYCGAVMRFDLQPQPPKGNKPSKDKTKTYIIPIPSEYASEDGVTSALKQFLLNTPDVPFDVFDHLEVKSVKWLYLPMYYFSGNVKTEWSCDEVIWKQREIGKRPVRDRNGNIERWEVEYQKYKEFLPKSGHGKGAFALLTPAIRKIKETLPYSNLPMNDGFISKAIPFGKGQSLIPSCASLRQPEMSSSDSDVMEGMSRLIRSCAKDCSFGNLRQIEHEHFTYEWALDTDQRVSGLFFIPFVYVIYSYKGEVFDWGFKYEPQRALAYDAPKQTEESPLEEREDAVRQELKSVEKRYVWNFALSFVLGLLVGAIIFFAKNHSLYERVKKRLGNQISMFGLHDKMRREQSLAKNGGIDENQSYNATYDDGWDEEYDDPDEDDKKPSSVEEIDKFFTTTEVMKKNLLKRMKRFWLWYIGTIFVVVACICAFNIWDNKQKDAMFQQEYEERMETISRMETELEVAITNAFADNYIGNTYKGSLKNTTASGRPRPLTLDAPKLTIRFVDEHTLICNGETYTYSMELEKNITKDYEYMAKPKLIISWGNYKTDNLIDYGSYLSHPFDNIPFGAYFDIIQGDDVYLMSRD